jgi:hypothetical protein
MISSSQHGLCFTVHALQARVPASRTLQDITSSVRESNTVHIYILLLCNALQRGGGRISPALLLQVPTAVFRAASARQAPAASFSACLVSKTRPIVPILLSKASVAEGSGQPISNLTTRRNLSPWLV